VEEEMNTGGGNGSGGGTGSGGGSGEVEVSEFVGTWDYTKVDLTNGILEIMGNEIGTFTGTGSKLVGEVVITENPNNYTTSVSFTAIIDADLGGQQQEQQSDVPTQASSGTWTESNGEITLTDDNGQDIAIVSSSSSKIVFSGEFSTQIPSQFFTLDATSDVVFTIEK
jgi:hypothetical protein|tara:strand:+ start:123 stop:626 length:504 start_codon:yes stop_codon:yes gene_type:complete